jgi:hypothetical protein
MTSVRCHSDIVVGSPVHWVQDLRAFKALRSYLPRGSRHARMESQGRCPWLIWGGPLALCAPAGRTRFAAPTETP